MTAVRRQIKNVVGNYSDVQVKVREATSNDPWGPSGALMGEIADATYHSVAFQEIMTVLWRRLNDHGKYWRHVYKALTVLEYIVKTGSNEVIKHCRDQMFSIQTLKDFQFIDKDGKDQGINVREKSKNLVALLKDEDRLEEERRKAKQAKQRFAKVSGDAGGSNSNTPSKRRGSLGSSPTSKSPSSSSSSSTAQGSQSWQPPRKNDASSPESELAKAKPKDQTEEALQLELAMALSREQAEKDRKMREAEDSALNQALSLSRTAPDGRSTSPWGNTAQPAGNDPWGGTGNAAATTSSTATMSDPWGTSGSRQEAAGSASPWGDAPDSKPTLQQTAAAATSASPWGDASSSAAPVVAADPWGSTPAPADPFAPTSTQAKPSDAFTPTSDFGSSNGFSPRSSPAGHPSAQPVQHVDPFGVKQATASVSAMSLMQQSVNEKKPTVENQFLGQNSGLVNLDTLGGAPPPAHSSPALSNPFAMPPASGTGGVRPLTSNPFQKDKPQAKSLNQMRVQEFTSAPAVQGGGGDLLPAPLIPDSSTSVAPQPVSNITPGPTIMPGPTVPPSGWGAAPMASMGPGMAPGMQPMAAGMQPMAPMGYGMAQAPYGGSPARNPFQQW